ncbi:hypothetical protein H2198_002777 [Neophaeococcomyces mojaviensis]|uniref:Uncharacterized protein n=1 Tax=Neophaeococcomyces mojaviensis TaxID=3383035 RepID=A0ACC3AD73_9EURO|nr:hypothetical protein H2198_002777 [Knufia sp. JES_112]
MAPKPTTKGEYIETETGNKISRAAQIVGAKHIVLAGKCVVQQGVVIRGDLVRPPQPTQQPSSNSLDPSSAATVKKPSQPNSVHLGRYVFISPNCTLHPPSRPDKGSDGKPVVTYYPLRISDYVFVGEGCNIRAAEIRSNVWIGKGVTVGNFAMIKENVKVLDGAVLPANSVWASGSVVAGAPARVVGELAEAWGGGGATSAGTGTGVGDEPIGVRARERWASVGNKK